MKTFITIFSFILLTGCFRVYSLISNLSTDFPESKQLTMVSKCDSLELLQPSSFVVKDSLLFVIDKTGEYLVRCFNINNSQELPKFILRGKAENEMISADYISLYGTDSINVVSFNPRIIKTYAINSVFDNNSKNSTLNIPPKIFSSTLNKISENTIFGAGRLYDRKNLDNYFIAEPDTIKTFGGILKELFVSDAPLEDKDLSYGVIFTVHPSKKKIAAASNYGLIFDVIDLNNLTIDRSKLYEKIHLTQIMESAFAPQLEGLYFATAIGSNSENVMIVKKEKQSRKQTVRVKDFKYELLVFDWNLNPVTKYEVPFKYSLQHITEDGKYLYLLVLNENGEKYSLIKYSIS